MIRYISNAFRRQATEILLVPHRDGMLAFEGRSIRIKPQVSKVIEILVAARGRIVTPDDLAQAVWGDERPERWWGDGGLLSALVWRARQALPKDAIANEYDDGQIFGERRLLGWRLTVAVKIEDFHAAGAAR